METTSGNEEGNEIGLLIRKTKNSEQDQFAPYRLSNTGKHDSLNTKLL